MAMRPTKQRSCPRCGGNLARDNSSGRCTPCQNAERDLLVAPPTPPADFWDHTPLRQALAERHMGHVIRAYRHHPYHGRLPLRQDTVGHWLGLKQAQVSRAENGRPIVYLDKLAHWAQILKIPANLLWFDLSDGSNGEGGEQVATTAASLFLDAPGGVDAMDRRTLLTTSATAPIAALLGANKPRISPDDARQVRSVVPEIYALDDKVGGDEVGNLARWSLKRVDTMLNSADYSAGVGQQLQAAYAELSELVGWLHFDAGRLPQASYFYGEALRASQLADDLGLEVLVLASMNTLARYRERPREAVQLIQLAQRRAAGWGTPRLMALLHAREAVCWAQVGDASAAHSAMNRAANAFDPAERADDPAWIAYFDGAELSARRATASTYLGRPDQAAAHMTSAVASLAHRFQRNRAYYGMRAGLSHLATGDVVQACAVVRPLLPMFTEVRSGRAHARLREFLDQAGQSKMPNAHDLLAYAHELGFRRGIV